MILSNMEKANPLFQKAARKAGTSNMPQEYIMAMCHNLPVLRGCKKWSFMVYWAVISIPQPPTVRQRAEFPPNKSSLLKPEQRLFLKDNLACSIVLLLYIYLFMNVCNKNVNNDAGRHMAR